MTMEEDNLPGKAVYDIYQDSKGFIWIVCSTGLARFDGISTKIYDADNTSYQGSTLYEIHEDQSGNFWLPTIGEGLLKFRDGDFSHFGKEQGLHSDIIKSIAITKGDTIWTGSYGNGIQAIYNDSVIATYTTNEGLIHDQVWRLMIDDRNRLWVGTNGGVSILDDGEFTNFTTENGLPYNVIRGLTQMQNGDVWIGTDKEGIVVFRDDQPYTYYDLEDGLNGPYPQFFAQNPADSSIWIAHHGNGLDRFAQGTFEKMNSESGLISNLATYIFFSREGLAFIGTEDGLSILKKRKIDVIDVSQGLTEDFLINVNEDSSGSIWVGTEGKGFNYKTQFGWQSIEYPPEHTNGYASGGAVDRNGDIWFNTKGTGTIKINEQEKAITQTYSTKNGLLSDFSRGLAFDYHNSAWIGTNEGLNIINQDGTIDTITTQNGLPHNFIMTTYAASDSSIWVGTFGGGAVRFKQDRITVFDTTNGLLTNKIYAFLEDIHGNIWISGSYGGLSVFDGDQINSFSIEHGLPSPGFNALVEDNLGNFWLGDGGGIYKIERRALYKMKNRDLSSLPVTTYSMEDGFPSQTLEVGYSSTAIKQSNGKVLFATNDGLAVIDPERLHEPAPPIKTYIDDIIMDGTSISTSGPITLQPEDNALEITYSAFNFTAPSKTKFKVKLSGINEQWVSMGSRRTVYYDFLPDGDYTFQVAATNADGQWKSDIATISLIVLPPFYKTWWFIALILLGVGSITAAVVRFRYKYQMNLLNQKIAIQHRIQKERERISRDLHDNVGSQITNLISGIEISRLHLDREESNEAYRVLKNLDQDARFAMTELRETIWLLNQKKVNMKEFEKHVKTFIKRQKYTTNDLKIEFENSLNRDQKLNPTQSLHLLRIIQEALNNCRKHSSANRFIIQLEQQNGSIMTTLKDNGKGMHLEKCMGTGNGLTNIRRRAKEMQGTCSIESSPGKGTNIQISIPLVP
jgi:signal transduction histidine kinase/ligand-binding sensor domain-containing protein